MTKDGKTGDFSEHPGSGELPCAETAEEAKVIEPPRSFSVSQDGLTVPKPSYYKHLEDGVGHDQDEQQDSSGSAEFDPRWSEAAETSDPLSAQKRARWRRIRYWAYFILVIVIYIVLRTGSYYEVVLVSWTGR